MRVVPLRLHPGDDLRLALEASTLSGDLEILSLAGTLSPDGAHLHIALANDTGVVTGGHLCAGSLVRTTAEQMLGLLPGWVFQRAADHATGCAELQITPPRPQREAIKRTAGGLEGQVAAQGRALGMAQEVSRPAQLPECLDQEPLHLPHGGPQAFSDSAHGTPAPGPGWPPSHRPRSPRLRCPQACRQGRNAAGSTDDRQPWK